VSARAGHFQLPPQHARPLDGGDAQEVRPACTTCQCAKVRVVGETIGDPVD